MSAARHSASSVSPRLFPRSSSFVIEGVVIVIPSHENHVRQETKASELVGQIDLARSQVPWEDRRVRTYGQYCAVAKALDVIGDRWSLLIVRELMIRGPCRYTDIRYGLPGIATNLLADRLRELERAGVIRRAAAPPPVATTLFHLTQRGKELRPVMRAIGIWGLPLLAEASDDDVFRGDWLAGPVTRSA